MTLLIIGGMLLIALLAILGAVFLGVSEQRTDRTRTHGNVSVSSSSSTPLVEQPSATSKATGKTLPLGQNLSQSAEESLLAHVPVNDQRSYVLNGQFHELAVELHTLYQHAWELERRLRTLAEVADRIEKTQDNQIVAETETRIQSSADSTL